MVTDATRGTTRRRKAPGRRKILKVGKRSALRKARSVPSFDAPRNSQSHRKSNEGSRKISNDLPSQFEFEMRFRSIRVQRLPRFAIDRHAAEVPFL
jgi:hypothetical protein